MKRVTVLNLSESYAAANQAAAAIILADVARSGGRDSLMVQWARRILRPTLADASVVRPSGSRAA